jgi:hypothetical protein
MMKLVAKSIALAGLVLVTAGSSYSEQLRSTSIRSSLADDEKRLLPELMSEFYGTFDKEKACWISKHEDATYCMRPIRLDVRSSTGRKMLFIVAGGQQLDEEGNPYDGDPGTGKLGLIVLTPNGANFGVVATNDFFEEFENYGRYPGYDSVTVHKLAANEVYGWLAKSDFAHSGWEYRFVAVYAVIGHSVEQLTAITSYYSDEGRCEALCTVLSVKYTFDTHSSASSFYPILLQVSGIEKGRPFRGNYRLVFDKNSLRYSVPENMPDEIRPAASRTEIKP